MKITETIEVANDPDSVWELFTNVPELARCLPGAEITGSAGVDGYQGKVAAKLGPMTANFEGECTVSADHETKTGVVEGRGTDRAGGSVAQVKLAYTVMPADTGTKVEIEADVVLSGAAAQFGRTGLIKEMSRRLIGEFAECIEAKLNAESEEEAAAVTAGDVRGVSLFFSSLWSAFSTWVRRPFSKD